MTMARMRELHVHELVLATARGITLDDYENLMSSNEIRSAWKAKHPGASELGLQAAFVKRFLAAHVEGARAMLAGMLAQPIDENLKATIHDALIKDVTLTRGRASSLVKRLPATENTQHARRD
jgi:hypothetical protein